MNRSYLNPSSDNSLFSPTFKQNPIREDFLSGLVNKDGQLHICVELLKNETYRNSDITDLMIDGYGIIPNVAFENCNKLERVVIGNNISEIGPKAFYGCKNLHTLTFLPTSTLNVISKSAFENTGLHQISLPRTVTKIGNNAFKNCKEAIVLSFGGTKNEKSMLEEIGFSAFEGCKLIRNVYLPESMKFIRQGAFYNCPNLKTVICGGDYSIDDNVWDSEKRPTIIKPRREINLRPFKHQTWFPHGKLWFAG
jgi:hypothetical protein